MPRPPPASATASPPAASPSSPARSASASSAPARHHLIYIPDPTVAARGIYHHIVSALGGRPSFHNAALVPQARDALAAEAA